MKCRKCKVEMQMQVVSETRKRNKAEQMVHVGNKLTIFPFLRRREAPLPTVGVTYAICPKCGKSVKIEKKKGILRRIFGL